jgi:hypothetical protein
MIFNYDVYNGVKIAIEKLDSNMSKHQVLDWAEDELDKAAHEIMDKAFKNQVSNV